MEPTKDLDVAQNLERDETDGEEEENMSVSEEPSSTEDNYNEDFESIERGTAYIAEWKSVEPTEDPDGAQYLVMDETDRDEENMSVSDDAACEEPSDTEDNDNTDMESIDEAASEVPSAIEDIDDNDLQSIEKDTLYFAEWSRMEPTENLDVALSLDIDEIDNDMSVNNDAECEELSETEENDNKDLESIDEAEDSDDEDLELREIHLVEEQSGDSMHVNREHFAIANDACQLFIEEVIHNTPSLQYLDLDDTKTTGFRAWRKIVLSEYFTLKCPALTQDKIDTLNGLDVPNKLMNFPDLYKAILKEQVQDFYFNETIILEYLDTLDGKSKRRSILKFIRIINIPCPFEYRDPLYISAYLILMPHLRRYFKHDSKLVIYVLHYLGASLDLRYRVFMKNEWEDLEFFIRHALKQKYNFWGVYDSQRCQDIIEDPFPTGMVMQNYPASKILLKYGFPYVFSKWTFIMLCRSLYSYTYGITEEDGQVVSGFLLSDGDGLEITLLELSPANMRSQMVLQIFFAFMQGLEYAYEEVVTKWMRSLPEPYVTRQEMYDRLKDVVHPLYKSELTEVTDSYAEAEVFDDDFSVLVPRRLLHLCRCSVRKRLQENYKLPDGINELGVPEQIQKYLLLEW